MKKTVKLLIKAILSVLLLTLLTVMYSPITLRIGYTAPDYAHVFEDANMSGDTKVVDIAMLGAHDAFSHKINLLSKPDPGEDGIIANKAVNLVFKGGLQRVTKAQKVGARGLLNRGVRYFDVRISSVGEKWYTKHALLDSELKYYVGEIYEFLKDKPKEFIVFDIQHIYLGEKTIKDFLDYFTRITLVKENLVFGDFVHHTTSIPVGDLDYFDVQGPARGGIIMLLNDDGTATVDQQKLFYARGNGESELKAIRSKWHDKTKVKDIIPFINEEAAHLRNESLTPYFRVNQAQLTPDYMKDPFGTLSGWSLINIGAISNKALLANEAFDSWLEVMPIFMVDFVNSRTGEFNKKINEKMITYNKTLSP